MAPRPRAARSARPTGDDPSTTSAADPGARGGLFAPDRPRHRAVCAAASRHLAARRNAPRGTAAAARRRHRRDKAEENTAPASPRRGRLAPSCLGAVRSAASALVGPGVLARGKRAIGGPAESPFPRRPWVVAYGTGRGDLLGSHAAGGAGATLTSAPGRTGGVP